MVQLTVDQYHVRLWSMWTK